MNVKKCDRCGMIYEDSQNTIEAALRDLQDLITGRKETNQVVAHLLKGIDLCDECIADFKEWLAL